MVSEGGARLVIDLKASIEVESLQQLWWGERPSLEGRGESRRKQN